MVSPFGSVAKCPRLGITTNRKMIWPEAGSDYALALTMVHIGCRKVELKHAGYKSLDVVADHFRFPQTCKKQLI